MTSHQGRERRAASQWALTQSMHVERNCFVCKKSCHFAEAMGVCVCGRSGFAAATLNARKKIFFVHLISGKYDLHARCLLLCICLPISSRSPFALCTLLGSDHSGAAPTQHTSLPFCISKPRTQPGAAPSPRSPSQVRLPQESSWETSLWAAAVLLLLGREAGRHCCVPGCASLRCAPMLPSVPWQQLTHVCHFLWSKQTVPTNHRCVVLVLVLSSSSPLSSAGANTGPLPMQGSLHHIPTAPFCPSHILLIPVLGVKLWGGGTASPRAIRADHNVVLSLHLPHPPPGCIEASAGQLASAHLPLCSHAAPQVHRVYCSHGPFAPECCGSASAGALHSSMLSAGSAAGTRCGHQCVQHQRCAQSRRGSWCSGGISHAMVNSLTFWQVQLLSMVAKSLKGRLEFPPFTWAQPKVCFCYRDKASSDLHPLQNPGPKNTGTETASHVGKERPQRKGRALGSGQQMGCKAASGATDVHSVLQLTRTHSPQCDPQPSPGDRAAFPSSPHFSSAELNLLILLLANAKEKKNNNVILSCKNS